MGESIPRLIAWPEAGVHATRFIGSSGLREWRRQTRQELINGDAFLLHRVAMTQRHGVRFFRSVFAYGIEIDSHAERCARLVLAAVATADGSGLVVRDSHVRAQLGDHFLRLRHQLWLVLEQREDADLDRGHARVETQHGAHLALAVFVGDGFLVEASQSSASVVRSTPALGSTTWGTNFSFFS